ncbi:GNAT family N-acetyltransferase [Actinoplanes sp. CA-015351]|uniref:GNAT family N-acetyltransferase n=1 Tax=Actinoplanes sp. CA-015351 TaxID=3239897 RepID=UPI003D9566E5
MDHQAVLALFDRQMRVEARPETAGTTIEHAGRVIRYLGGDQDWNAVIWSDLDPATADETIDGEIRWFGERGLGFEWKHYGHDQPADLAGRLARAGFEPEGEETVMVAAIDELDLDTSPPDGIRFEEIVDPAGVEVLVNVAEKAFGAGIPWLRPRLLAQLADAPENVRMFVAFAGDEAVSSARMDLTPGTAFAGLWGGGTVGQWRGRGIYRALVAHRARLALALGYAYLQVDATDQSRPILQRLGFEALTTTTPFQWSSR